MEWSDIAPEQKNALLQFAHRLADGLLPPSDIKPSEYAKENIIITSGPRKGIFIPDPYQVEILDTAVDPRIKKVTSLKSVQSGLSTVAIIIAAWAIDIHAMQIGYVFPNQEEAKKFAKDRLHKEFNYNLSLKQKMIVSTNRTAGTTTRNFKFTNGGLLYMLSAATPAELRSFSAQMMILDELSGYEVTKEGSANKIAEGRGEQWEDFKIYQFSTPAKEKGADPTENEYQKSSCGLFHVPCPRCGFYQPLRFRDQSGQFRLVFEKEKNKVIKESVHYLCENCNGKILEKERVPMIHAGKWVHEFPDNWEHRGFRLNSLYPVTKSNQWYHVCSKFLESLATQEDLRTFINLHLGETFKEDGTAIGAELLKKRLENYPYRVVPTKTAFLVATVDVQANRLELAVWAMGPGQEMWLVDTDVFPGDPNQNSGVWELLDEYLLTPMPHELTGEKVYIDICGIDTGFQLALNAVNNFIIPRQKRATCPVYGIKGEDKLAKRQEWSKPAFLKSNPDVKLYILHSNLLKTHALNALRHVVEMDEIILEGGEVAYLPRGGQDMTNYVHLPIWMTDEEIKQIAAVKYTTEVDKDGKEYIEWHERKRNEQWDLFYYAYGMYFTVKRYLSDRFTDLEAAMLEKQKSRSNPKRVQKSPSAIMDIKDIEA